MAIKKGPTKGSGGKHRNALRGKGPTPKAEDRVYHKAYKAKQATNRRKMADPRLAARRRAAKFTSDSDDLVIGRNAVLEALRVGVPSMQLYIATRIEHDDRTREIIKLAGAQSLHLLEADRLEMDRIARSSNHQGVVLKVQPYQYSSLAELADIAERKAKAMDVVNSPSARINARPLFIALDGVTDPQNLGAAIRSAAAFGANGVILPERRSASVTAAAWKVSAGAAAHIPVARVVNLTKAIESMRERGYYTVGLDGGGDKLVGETGFETDPLIVVLGSEGDRRHSDHVHGGVSERLGRSRYQPVRGRPRPSRSSGSRHEVIPISPPAAGGVIERNENRGGRRNRRTTPSGSAQQLHISVAPHRGIRIVVGIVIIIVDGIIVIRLIVDHAGIRFSVELVHGFVIQLVVRQHGLDVAFHSLAHRHVVAGLLGKEPAVIQHLMEELCRLDLRTIFTWNHTHGRLIHLTHPIGGDDLQLLAFTPRGGTVRIQIVEQAPRLILLHI